MRTITRDIVGAFIISADNHVLLGQSITGGVFPDKWVVPGGGIEDGETKLQAVIRETLEEVGIDIADAEITPIDTPSYGESPKTLRDSGETVLVKMTFFDFVVKLSQNANDISLSFEDDLSIAKWFSPKDLQNASIGKPTEATLRKINFI